MWARDLSKWAWSHSILKQNVSYSLQVFVASPTEPIEQKLFLQGLTLRSLSVDSILRKGYGRIEQVV